MKIITEKQAPLIYKWCIEREGIAEWPSHDLGNPGSASLTPWLTPEKVPANMVEPPHWKHVKGDCKQIKLEEIQVGIDKEFKRIPFYGRRTERKLDRLLDEAGKYSRYEFDPITDEAIVYQCIKLVPLAEYMKTGLSPVQEAK